MGLTASDTGGGDYTPIPQGMQQAICTGIFDLGTQLNEYFGKRQHKVLFCWELPGVRAEFERDGEMQDLPKAISKEYTLSLNEKANLRKDLETWRGKSFTIDELKGFNLKKVLGANCVLQILHKVKNDKTFANISSIMPLVDGMDKKEPENPLRFYSLEDDMDIPEGTPEWICKKINAAEELNLAAPDEPFPDETSYTDYDIDEDTIPF